jgi:uncharacterized membrane protein YgcG
MGKKSSLKVTVAVGAALLVALTLSQSLDAQSETSTPGASPTAAAPRSASELQSLVAPIALYPDSLVAQVLTGATFPDQIAVADYWLQENKSLTGSALMHAVDGQSWDASVKALTQFPSVLDNMAKNLAWTSSLGEAYHDQQSEVMTAIQALRAQAKAHGTLKSSSQITVAQQSPEVIVIQPANPQIVYVPQYNPAVIYGTPYLVPNYVAPVYTAGDVAAAGIIGFGAGIAVGAMMHGGCCSWGYSAWNCGWHGTAVVYHGGAYYGNAAWHGGYYNGGYHPNYGYNNSFNRTSYNQNTFNKNISGNTVNVNKSSQNFGQDRSNFDQAHPQASQNFSQDRSSFDASHPSAGASWTQHDSGSGTHSSAFSGLSGHSGGFGDSGGWASRADSSRGWGSMRSSGFGGGRFGGFGGGGFGGGRFGGFRR